MNSLCLALFLSHILFHSMFNDNAPNVGRTATKSIQLRYAVHSLLAGGPMVKLPAATLRVQTQHSFRLLRHLPSSKLVGDMRNAQAAGGSCACFTTFSWFLTPSQPEAVGATDISW
ncbi:unnamed protein product [Effrenium voratum]|uniref:Secreted protein n=1 Tax=Effrenium voratum TaxID=2562239 RepID=A0AA36IEN3_9DINO|nr:unnamed protein product [Effrenium voratum]CAJ1454969.1 unnamed protein product [Effrenium voratum]